MGQAIYDFIDFLEKAGQKIWQILPLTQTDSYLSPYASPDGFAGNHLLIDLESLPESRILSQKDWQLLKNKDKKSYREKKEEFLRAIYKEWIKKEEGLGELKIFYQKEKWWLAEHIQYYGAKKNEKDPNYLIFLQKIFMDQYLPIKKYANEKGISILGDLPFYVNLDSREVFSDEKYFLLGKKGVPLWQGGVPPDSFQDQGQLWGVPAYNWQAIEADDFSFWLKKIRRLAYLYDYLRLDHFRGFESVWLTAWEAEDARKGHWYQVPGHKLFARLAEENSLGIIAENLGHITPQVEELLQKYNLPGMKVLQFLEDDLYLFKESKNNIYYTGTHDNDTLLSWVRKKFALPKHLEKEISWDFIKKVWRSQAIWAIVPMQDLLFLGEEARMNLPGTLEGNWQWTWKADYSELETLSDKLKKLSQEAGR